MRRNNRAGYLMILPFYTIFIVFTLIPIVICIVYSFTNYDLYKRFDFVGLQNYRKMLDDEVLHIALRNTLVYCLYTILPSIALGLLLAQTVNNKVYGIRLIRTCFYLPYVLSMVCAAMIWMWMLDPTYGFANYLMRLAGLPEQQWLYDKRLAMPTVAVISIWKNIGYNMLLYLSALQSIPETYYEAAKLDGAGAFTRFARITVPLVKPTTFFIFVTTTISSFNVFEQVKILTNGGPSNATTTLVHQIYTRAFDEFNMGYAASEAMLLFVIVLLITMLNLRFGYEGSKIDLG